MTDKTFEIISIIIIIIIDGLLLAFLVWQIFWGVRELSFEHSFVYQASAKSPQSEMGAIDFTAQLDTPFIGAKSNPFGPGASVDLAASTRPKGDWKTITAYNAEIAQTDSNPRIMASGKEVREGFVAYNCAPFGTRMIIEGREYEVQDRMAKKWGCGRVDIFMENYQSALRFGKQRKQVIILE